MKKQRDYFVISENCSRLEDDNMTLSEASKRGILTCKIRKVLS